jgi:hypothetical protein
LETFKENYSPTREQAIDECMIKFKGRIGFKQYMPQKPVKRGYKIWVWADKTGYVCDIQIYTGKIGDKAEKNLGERVVQDLCQGLEGKGYHIYFDNFFTSVSLMSNLKKKWLPSCGTVRANCKGLPSLKRDDGLKRGECDWSVRSDGLACVKWKDKCTVMLSSSIDSPTNIQQVNRKEKDSVSTSC